MTTTFHPKCRPPRDALRPGSLANIGPLRLGDDNRWRVDNGEPGVAFIGRLDDEHHVWVASCKCTDAKCPRWKALEHAREKLDIESISVHERPRKGSTRR